MLLEFFRWLAEDFGAFNVFNYISLRAVLAVITSLIVSFMLGPWFIKKLGDYSFGQYIRNDGPEGHLIKSGTPTMGGLLVVPVGVIVGGLISWSGQPAEQLLAVAFITLAYMVVGGIDDWRSLTKHTNTGLTPRGKLMLQALAAVIFRFGAGMHGWISGDVACRLISPFP